MKSPSTWPRLLVAVICSLIVLWLPREWFPIENLTVVEQRVAALFVFAALSWMLEPLPVFATSVLVITLLLVFVSDAGLVMARGGSDAADFGPLLPYREVMATFASPIILLFLGGFFLAMAATKYRLDLNLARVLLRPFGEKPAIVMLGLMVVTATFSMFMSNTATTAMMLAILVPILGALPEDDPGRAGLALSIPVAANLGGIGTPIGTPPNAIALKYLTGENAITFGKWMGFGIPFVILILLIAWLLLRVLFPFKSQQLRLDIRSRWLVNRRALLVYATFIVTVLLWLTDFLHGMNAYVVAMIPVAVFVSTNIITKEDLKLISWDVLWLVAGGLALGLALEASGLARHLVESIPFSELSPLVIGLMFTLIGLAMANFLSHTATANLLLPIVAVVATAFGGQGAYVPLILSATLAISLGMSLPISSPPNALASATGVVQTSHMVRVGVLVGVIGYGLVWVMMAVLGAVGYF